MNVESLVLGSGDHVEVTGVVVRTSRGFGLLAGLVSDAIARDGVFGPSTHAVAFEVAPGDEPSWTQRLGNLATVRGTWQDGALTSPALVSAQARITDGPADWASDFPVGAEPSEVTTAPTPLGDVRGVEPPIVQQIRDAEGPLWASGSMIWRTATGGPRPTRYLAAAHEPGAVAAALAPILGDALKVVPSPWSRQVYADIDAASHRAEDLGLLFRTEQGMGEDGVVRIRLGVLHVSWELADVVRSIPEGPLSLEPFVRPIPQTTRSAEPPLGRGCGPTAP